MKNKFSFALLLILIVLSSALNSATIYVDSSKTSGLNNGTNWTNAYVSFQSALNSALSGDEIWVAKGTYKPSSAYDLTNTSRYYHFRMKNNVAIYGGFSGIETTVSQRTNFGLGEINETILSGDLNDDDIITGNGSTLSFNNNAENCYHVFYHPSGLALNNTAILNGFTIKGGNANSTAPHINGGAFYNISSSPALVKVNLIHNFSNYTGGAISNAYSSMTLNDAIISQNLCLEAGGAMYSTDSSPILNNVLISGNKSQYGAAITSAISTVTLTNVTLVNNAATYRGGGLYNYYTTTILNNCIILLNSAPDSGSQIYLFTGGGATLNYSCYSNNTNDIVGGINAVNNNITASPLFANIAENDFRLTAVSPCADAGNNIYNSQLNDIRGIGFDRKLNKTDGTVGTIDMGAYEYKFGTDPLISCVNPTDGGIIAASQTVCSNYTPAIITNSISATGFSGSLEYQWYSSTTNSSSGFSAITSATNATYQSNALNQTTWFKRLARVSCMSNWNGAAETNVIEIQVNPAFSYSASQNICQGQSYSWQGNTYTTTGTYTANYTTVNGCDSIYTLNLIVNPIYSFNENHSICSGQTYNWQGTNYTAAGTYIASYSTINGCDSIYTLSLTVNPLPVDLNINNGLAAYYPFNNNANDESGNANHGTLFGPVLTADKNSVPNSAYNFDGIDDYILINNPVPANLQIQNEITLSAWIYVTQYPNSGTLGLIVGSQCDNCGGKGASIFLDGRTNSDGQPSPAGHIHFQIGDGAWHTSNSNSQVPLNQWVHIVATRKANETAKIYYNGVSQPVTSMPWSGSISYTGAYFAIGRQKDYSNRFFKGTIDEVRVYNRALNTTEIDAIYNPLDVYADNDTLCANNSTNIHLINSKPGISYQLQQNGNNVGSSQTGNGTSLIFNTGNLTSPTPFTIKATNITSSCEITLDTIVNIHVGQYPTITSASVSPNAICVSGQVVFSATASAGTIKWYDALTNGNLISVLNPTINTNTTYYAEALSPEGCISLTRTSVTAAVNPAHTFSLTQSICNGQTYNWQGTNYTTAGTYTASYSTINGCDSIYTLNLIVNPTYAFNENHTMCNGQTYNWQGNNYTTAGTYTTNYSTINGCDSIYTLNLIVNPTYAFNENHSICNGQTYNWQGNNYTTAGTYTVSYSTISGCDSIYTLNLIVNPTYSFNENHSICNGQTYNWQGTNYTAAGTYTASYSSINGCDSIYTLNLIVNPTYSFNENHTMCNGQSYNWQGTNYTTAGTYTASYSTINGCDSIYTLNLIVNPTYSFNENHSICNGQSYNWQGTNYTTAGTYTANYSTINGCDSIYFLNLNINTIDVSVTSADPTISANLNGAIYQWLDCNNSFAPISGATSQSYAPTANGSYAVMITQGSCTDTSACVQINSVGLTSFDFFNLSVYPNPVKDKLTIEMKGYSKTISIEILNAIGQIVYKDVFAEKINISLNHLPDGIYILKLDDEKFTQFKKIIKEQ